MVPRDNSVTEKNSRNQPLHCFHLHSLIPRVLTTHTWLWSSASVLNCTLSMYTKIICVETITFSKPNFVFLAVSHISNFLAPKKEQNMIAINVEFVFAVFNVLRRFSVFNVPRDSLVTCKRCKNNPFPFHCLLGSLWKTPSHQMFHSLLNKKRIGFHYFKYPEGTNAMAERAEKRLVDTWLLP
jgi:hypothetical protein